MCLRSCWDPPELTEAQFLSSCAFFSWLAVAARQCQMLGFHKLGEDSNRMPLGEDPAFPPGPSSIKREISKRIWFYILSYDMLNASAAGMRQIPDDSCK